MADHQLIAAQLDTLARRLPAAAFDEIADGLRETYAAQLDRYPDPDQAAHATIAQFGDAAIITAAFIQHSPWRRSALALLATGPVIGGLWAATLITGGWAHSIPTLPRTLFGGALVAIVVTLLAVATTSKRCRHTRVALVASASALVMLDVLMVSGVLTLGPPPAWPLALAVTGSAVRALSTLRMIPWAITTD